MGAPPSRPGPGAIVIGPSPPGRARRCSSQGADASPTAPEVHHRAPAPLQLRPFRRRRARRFGRGPIGYPARLLGWSVEGRRIDGALRSRGEAFGIVVRRSWRRRGRERSRHPRDDGARRGFRDQFGRTSVEGLDPEPQHLHGEPQRGTPARRGARPGRATRLAGRTGRGAPPHRRAQRHGQHPEDRQRSQARRWVERGRPFGRFRRTGRVPDPGRGGPRCGDARHPAR